MVLGDDRHDDDEAYHHQHGDASDDCSDGDVE